MVVVERLTNAPKLVNKMATWVEGWSVAGAAIDTAVAAHVLEAINSEQLDISLAVLEELDYQAQEADKTWQLRLERARYEADRAFRQYDATEPENRLVARTLERRWNEKLQQLAELEEAYSQAHQVQRLELTAEQRQQILHLAFIYSHSLAR